MLHGARRRVWPGIRSSSRCTRKNSSARGLTGFTRSGRKTGSSDAPWDRSSTTRSSCRRLAFLCRRWKTNWWRYAGCSISSFPSRLSKCPRSPLPVILAGAVCISRSRRRNSWWKCRRSYLTPRCTGLLSRTWTFQFRVVAEFFILHRRLLVCRVRQINGFSHFSPKEQSATFIPHPGSELGADSTSSTLAVSSRMQLVCGCSFQVVGGSFWARIQKSGGLGDGWDGALVMRQSTNAFGRISSSFVQFAIGIWCNISVVLVSGNVWVLLRSTENWFLRETSNSVGAMLGTTVDTCSASGLW